MGTRGSEDRSVLSRPASAPDAVLTYGTGDQPADVRLAPDAPADRPLLVVVHGGFWRPAFDRVHVRPMTEALAAAGWPTVTPEYRRSPGRPDLAVEDVHAAVRAVAGEPQFAGRRLVLVGHSAGGHLALHAAATLEPASAPYGVLALAPVADLRRAQELRLDGDAVPAFLGQDAGARPDLDPARLPTPAGRVRIVHGTGDAVVPVEVSEAYLRRHPDAVLTPVECGHFALIDPRSAAWPTVLAALEDLR
ncbi:alpha/beta hydrolase [Blastococcus brunescens]|uniref:Alpha/beta hydrolase n=1 Tax=Blastococcus brunescens TaxID=1564165 RepID=A0ABZ1B6Z7_9ACTN|nr:alpha/beta hydrolase [Blastococcus sp. BMG 8361]WRL66570.1 alpha/beta hydrolase [Blastococcus sp. BMG 8361]